LGRERRDRHASAVNARRPDASLTSSTMYGWAMSRMRMKRTFRPCASCPMPSPRHRIMRRLRMRRGIAFHQPFSMRSARAGARPRSRESRSAARMPSTTASTHAARHRTARLLERVADGVAEVQDRPATGAGVVALGSSPATTRAFRGNAARDGYRQHFGIGASARPMLRSRYTKSSGSATSAVLSAFSHAGGNIARIEGGERGRIDGTNEGWWKTPTRFLPAPRLIAVFPPTPHRLPRAAWSDRAPAQPAQVGRRDETAEVGHGAAADGDQHRIAIVCAHRPASRRCRPPGPTF